MTETPEPSRPGKSRWKIPAVIACIAGAFGLALYLHKPAISGSSAAKPVADTAESAFAAIPLPTGNSASEKAVTAALTDAHKKPTSAEAWATIGDTLAQRLRDTTDQNFYKLAGTAYMHALSLDSANVAAMNGMAWVTGGAHKFDESIAWADKSIAVNPANADAFGILGDANLELGNYEDAFDQYQKMMDLRPDLSSWSRGAWLLWLTGDTLKSGNLMQQAIRAGGAFAENTAWCRAKLATMYFQDGSYPAAAEAVAPSLKEHSKNPHILLIAAHIAEATQEPDVAAEYYKLMLIPGPNHDALAGLGDLAAAKGDAAEAEKYYRQVEELHAANLSSGVHDHMKMALFLADHDRNIVEAMRLAEQHKLTKNVLEADALAWVYYKNGENDKAIKAIKLALSRHTPDSGIHYHAGMIALKAGDLESARRHLQVAIAQNPRFSVLQAPLAAKALEEIATRNRLPAAAAQSTGIEK